MCFLLEFCCRALCVSLFPFCVFVDKHFVTYTIIFIKQLVLYNLGPPQVKDAAGSVKSAAGSAGNKAKDLVGQG